MSNALFFGDNLEVLRDHVKDESADLIYLDPPFNSDAGYNVLFGDKTTGKSAAQASAFRDTWEWGEHAAYAFEEVMRQGGRMALLLKGMRAWMGENAMMAYVAMMAVRLTELRRVLKPTGSLYLHCDPSASHYLKLLLDASFGAENFRSEIVWKRTGSHAGAARWAPVHDTIFFYSAGDRYTWNRQFQAYERGYIEERYDREDKRGRFQDVSLTGPGTREGESGLPWRGHDPTSRGRHWAVPKAAAEAIQGFEQLSVHQKLDALDAADLLYWTSSSDGLPRVKQFPGAGVPLQDCILDVPPLNARAKERLGYPTQKPVALLRRIISASSRPGDVVLDPFCGCGTTVEAAEQLGRDWTGIDVTHYAVTLIEARMRKSHPDARFAVRGRPTDLVGARDLARRDKHQFQWWSAWLLGAHSYNETKKGADRGIDGNIFFPNGPYGHGRIIISVKGGENVGPAFVRELAGVLEREQAEMGVLVLLAEPTRAMTSEAASAGHVRRSAHGPLPRLQIVTVGELLAGKRPHLPVIVPPRVVQSKAPKAKRDTDQLEMMLEFQGGAALGRDAHIAPDLLPFEQDDKVAARR
jgi:site-specific DNA-methyltransferase (adenine-specific)